MKVARAFGMGMMRSYFHLFTKGTTPNRAKLYGKHEINTKGEPYKSGQDGILKLKMMSFQILVI